MNFSCSIEDILRREKEIKGLQESNQNLVIELGEIIGIRQAVTYDHENKWQPCLAKPNKIDLLKNEQNNLQKKSGKISRELNKCVRKHNDVKNKLKEKIGLIKIIKTMIENIETENKKAAEHRKGVERKPEDSTKHKSKKQRLSKDEKRIDMNKIVGTSNESHPVTCMDCEATDDQKQTDVKPVSSAPKIIANVMKVFSDSTYEERVLGTNKSKHNDNTEMFSKASITTNAKTNDSIIDLTSNKSISRHSSIKPVTLIGGNSTLSASIKTNTTSNSLLNTVKPVSSSPKVNKNFERFSKVNVERIPVQAKKVNVNQKIVSAKKGEETKGKVKEVPNPEFLEKLMLRRKFLIRTLTTKKTGEQNASDQELNNFGPPTKKSKSSDVFSGTKKM